MGFVNNYNPNEEHFKLSHIATINLVRDRMGQEEMDFDTAWAMSLPELQTLRDSTVEEWNKHLNGNWSKA